RVRGNPVQIAKLKNAHAKRDANFLVELELFASREMLDQVVQLRLMPEASKRDAFGQREIARIALLAAQQIGGIAAAMDALEDSEGDFAGGGHSFQYECECIPCVPLR